MNETTTIRTINELHPSAGPIYFIGVGGIGMSALARYFVSRGFTVAGYDKTATPLTAQLEKEGVKVHFDDNPSMVPEMVQLVVYTPAVPKDHREWQLCKDKGYPLLKRSEVLGLISNGSFNICIGGTHGKTTTTTMVAHLLRATGYGCNAFLGGISGNYDTNFWSDSRNVSVIEADEYDRSFLRLSPDIAVISSMDPDHLDIYGTEEAMQEAFIAFAARVKKGGTLLSRFGLKRGQELVADTHLTYSRQNSSADIYAANVVMENGGYRFDLITKDSRLGGLVLHMGGMHNVENAVVAVAIAHLLGIAHDAIQKALADFKGVKRRFEYIIPPLQGSATSPVIFIDDYAHHPTELKALISGAKALFSGKKCTVIFQPHLYSRTRDLTDDFAESLDLADEVLLLPIYPARELPIEGVSSQLILDKMKLPARQVLDKDALIRFLQQQFLPGLQNGMPEVLITAGAGDIDALVPVIKNILTKA